MSMMVSDIRYEIVIVAVKGDHYSYIVELKRTGVKDLHWTVGPGKSLPNLVKRIADTLERGEELFGV